MVTKEKVVQGDTKQSLVAGLNIDKIVKRAQEAYSKKEQGLSRQLSTGNSIVRPSSDEDFVVWSKGDHWKTLTHLKGIPFGRIIQISGKPDSGKSTHAMAFMKFAQDQDIVVVLWDAERKFSAERFDSQIGGKSNNLLIVDTNNITNGAKAVAHFIHAIKEESPKAKILVVWDSVGASINSTEDTEESEDYSKQPGVTAKEVSYAIKKFNRLSNQYSDKETGQDTIATLVINQTYANIGSVGQTEKGGSELYYLSSVVVQLARKQDLTRVKDGNKFKYGIVTRAKVKKNHLFDGGECIAEMDLVISADGVHLAQDVKNFKDIQGWEGEEE